MGCVIFVKLWQFESNDRTRVRIDTGKMPFLPASDRPDVELMPLFQNAREQVRLERWAPNARIEFNAPDGIEILVLDGHFNDGAEDFTTQTWLRLPAGARLRAKAGTDGCKIWIKTGHLG